MSHYRIKHEKGLTLIELMVVISVIVIISVIAIPNLTAAKLTSNEASAVQTMRTLVGAQATFKARNYVDNEFQADGDGEYGYLAELAGTRNLRGGAFLPDPPTVSTKLGMVRQSVATTAGYHFAIFLPDINAAGVPEDADGGKLDETEVDPDMCERHWVAYAWPSNLNQTGNRVYVVNETGEVLATDNRGAGQGYSGLGNPPPFDAAFTAAGDMSSNLSINGGAVDGGNWVSVR